MPYLHDQPYVLTSFLSGFRELVISEGGRFDSICEAVELAPHEVSGPRKLIPFDRFIGLLEAAAVETGCGDFALQLAARQDLSILGPLVGRMRHARSVEAALNLLARELSLLVWGLELFITKERQRIDLQYRVTLPTLVTRKQFQDYLLGSTATIVRQLVGSEHPPRGLFFSRSPSSSESLRGYDDVFQGPVAFGVDTPRLTYDPNILTATLRPLPVPRQVFQKRQQGESLRQQVMDTLALALPSGDVTLPDVAAELACSERTLRRHLASHNLSFENLRDELRYTMANDYLSSTCYSLGNIAALLGFANQSAFTRSYLRWSGQTPSAFRKQLDYS